MTVDADTILPPGSVAALAGTLAHPLNEPVLDPQTGKLCAGYTIIQPRVEISPQTGTPTLFARLYGGDTAIDIYSRAVSDIYQDLFGSAVYVGKGIYDVASFPTLPGRTRRRKHSCSATTSSKGANGRVALASDIVLYDSFPDYLRRIYAAAGIAGYAGTGNFFPWLAPRVPMATGKSDCKLTCPGSSAGRSSTIFAAASFRLALVALAVSGWLLLPGSGLIWTSFTIAAPGIYLFTDLISGLVRGHRRGVVQSSLHQFAAHAGRWGLAVVFLLHDAIVSLDAIGRTLWRLFVSRRHLLAWTSAAHSAARVTGHSRRETAWQEMWPASVAAIVFAALLASVGSLSCLRQARFCSCGSSPPKSPHGSAGRAGRLLKS